MFNDNVRYLGILDDPVTLAPASIHERAHVLVIRDLTEAKAVLEGFYVSGDSAFARDLSLKNQGHLVPGGTSREARLTLYRVDCKILDGGPAREWEGLIEAGDPYPEYVLSIGPRGGIRQERA